MMTMQEFYERALRRVSCRDAGVERSLESNYLEVECSIKRDAAALYQISDLGHTGPNKIIRGRTPEECLHLWDVANMNELANKIPDAPEAPRIIKATHLANGGVQ
jgi:hypothetical protein